MSITFEELQDVARRHIDEWHSTNDDHFDESLDTDDVVCDLYPDCFLNPPVPALELSTEEDG